MPVRGRQAKRGKGGWNFQEGQGGISTVRRRAAIAAYLSLAASCAFLICSSSALGERAGATDEDRQPRNIYELLYSIDHTFSNVLMGDELKLFRTWSPELIKEKNPELYDRISHDVKAWTD